MKVILYLGAAVALLRSAAAFLPTDHDNHDDQDQLVFRPAKGINTAANIPGASTKHTETEPPPQRFSSDSLQLHDTPSENTPQTPQKSNFTIGSSSSQWAITYTPYTDALSCLSASSIRSDVATIARKGFSSIRLYSIDCSALLHVGHAARAHGLKMIIGIHIDENSADTEIQISEITDWARSNDNDDNTNWDLIELIVVGNEAIFNSYASATALASLITNTRATLRLSGYPGPLTTSEPLSILSAYAHTLCPTLDLAAATIQPFFHPSVTPGTAGAYVSAELARLAAVCPGGLAAVSLESGWPSRGRANGEAVPGYLEQWVAVAEIVDRAGGRSVVAGFADEAWRDEGQFGVEGSWGCGHVFGE
ncbi:hypothetical protein IMSHALPRED_001715 [Imshaugia aleurites]|uniref:Probable beta-glucosidase btgE n=1 Tax=Imshaugia aleurites TaxID=172621 RepID=A0A8H3J3G0_9LECA|nr:hypothetical protein IMSHALPRED_001715 [Imshaugia aleurites]